MPSVFIATALGTYSDRIGRKPCLILASVGAFVFAFGVLVVELADADFRYIFVAEALAGLSGGPSLMFMALFAS